MKKLLLGFQLYISSYDKELLRIDAIVIAVVAHFQNFQNTYFVFKLLNFVMHLRKLPCLFIIR